MIIVEGRDVLRHDFHTHSVQSACGMHTVAEIMSIAARKGVETVNICDHGSASGRNMSFGVITDRRRTPMQVPVAMDEVSVPLRLLAGIEANVLDDGGTDLPLRGMASGKYPFAVISAGFHAAASGLKEGNDPQANLEALHNYVTHYPLDILTHPCIKTFPLPVVELVQLAKQYGFALEVNNTNLVVEKTQLDMLGEMIEESLARGVTLLCNSDGHTWHEMFECGAARVFVEDRLNLVMEEVFPINFGPWEQVVDRFPRIFNCAHGKDAECTDECGSSCR